MPNRNKRSITAEDLYALQTLSGVRIAPDGSQVVYCLQRTDRKTEKKYTNLWIAPTDGSEPRQFTVGNQADTQPCWSPDSRQIAFLSNRGDLDQPPQVYLIPVDGGEAQPLTSFQGQIGEISWSPDGKRLACAARKKDREVLERDKDDRKKKLGVVARHYDRVFFKLDGSGYKPKERWHLWTVDAKTGKMRQITDHPVFDENQPAWSPDGKWIVFISNRSPNPDLNHNADDLFMIPARGGEIRRLETNPGSKGLPAFSPDGKSIAYYSSEDDEAWYKNRSLYIIPVDGTAPARNLTESDDLHLEANVINDVGVPETMPPIWSPDGQRLYFPAMLHGSSLLLSINRNGENLETVIPEGGAVGSYGFDHAHSQLAFFYGRIDDPAQVMCKNLANGETRQLTHLNRALLDQLDLGTIEEIWFNGADGNDLQGWILKPPDFDPARRYPSILEIHGGPWTQYGWFFMHEFYFLAAHGYVVTF
jgi:dipeptidyl aminopeptidase/acylaminoacyl peptidase